MSKPIPIPKAISKGSLINYPNEHNINELSDLKQVASDDYIMGYDRQFPSPPSSYPSNTFSLSQMENQVAKMLYQSSPSQYDSYISPNMLSSSPVVPKSR